MSGPVSTYNGRHGLELKATGSGPEGPGLTWLNVREKDIHCNILRSACCLIGEMVCGKVPVSIHYATTVEKSK